MIDVAFRISRARPAVPTLSPAKPGLRQSRSSPGNDQASNHSRRNHSFRSRSVPFLDRGGFGPSLGESANRSLSRARVGPFPPRIEPSPLAIGFGLGENGMTIVLLDGSGGWTGCRQARLGPSPVRRDDHAQVQPGEPADSHLDLIGTRRPEAPRVTPGGTSQLLGSFLF